MQRANSENRSTDQRTGFVAMEERRRIGTPIAIIVAAALLSVAYVLGNLHTIVTDSARAYSINVITGSVTYCQEYECRPTTVRER